MGDDGDEKEFIPNPPEFDGAPDLSQLIYLEMRHVLINLHHRYSKMARKYCYTSISTILVAINPYERLPIYGPDVIEEFHSAAKKGVLPRGRPHPYGVTARSYMRMIQRKKNQSVIVCGESGAGKSETAKLLMRYLAMTAPSSTMESSIIEQQIIAASPILEAYGNAKTVMNNNSSRFGKFTKLLYDVPEKAREGSILGSYLETYLLEKSRVVFQSNNERNYHIFYFLHKGLQKSEFDELELSDCDKFWYTNQGKASEVAGVNDKERYDELAESLRLMRIEAEQSDLWRITAGLLHLGNCDFKREGDGFASVKQPKNTEVIGRLWAVGGAAVKTRLETKTLIIMKKPITQKINFDEASANRDSITKGFYEQIFLYLCQRINAELYQTSEEEDLQRILFIGILDVFGFENFWINSLEQFCINFTNEKLQQFFNFHIIKSEQEEYIKESIFWTPLSVPDNVHYLDMVEADKTGFFSLLDSACRAPQPSVEAWMQEFFKVHGKNPTVKRAKGPGAGNARGRPKKGRKKGKSRARFEGWNQHHFADHVCYDASSFLVKNMEAVHADTAKMLKKSDNALVTQIGTLGVTKKKKKSTVTGVFYKGIRTLMKNLKQTEPFFVRCVNPNGVKSSKVWDEPVVEGQLRCGGMIEALKVLKLGYPTRVPYSTLYEKFHSTITNPLCKNMGPEALSTALLIAFDVTEEDYELGLTKIFFKPAKAAVLDTIMSHAGRPLSADQNVKITKWVVQKRIKQMIGTCKAFCELRNRVRLTRAARRWQHVGRISSILAYSVVRHLRMAREIILERKRQEAAVKLQSFFRGTYECSHFRKHLPKVKMATKMIWKSYRRWNERRLLKEWLDKKVEETRKRKAAERKRLEAERRELERKEMEQKEREKLEKARAEKAAARAAEEKRLREEQERKRLEAEEKKREEERIAAEKKRKEEEAAEQARLKQEQELAKARQELAQLNLEKQRMEEEKKQREEQRAERNASIKMKRSKRRREERNRKAKAEEAYAREVMPEMYSDDEDSDGGSDEESYEDDEPKLTVSQRLRTFNKAAATGQLFSKYTGKRRRKPQDRIVKVSFSEKNKPRQISWGSGSRHIDFEDILYVVRGHWTPVFQARKEHLDPKLCFSVVGKTQILDVQAQSADIAELWTRGLRKLIHQSEEEAQKLAKQALENNSMPGQSRKDKDKANVKEHKKRAKSLMLLQQDLFVMTTTTCFRNLEEERIWDIDQSVRDKFNAKLLYEEALRQDIPWRNWTNWIREKIVTYLRENNRVAQPQQMAHGYADQYSQAINYHAPPQGMYGHPQPAPQGMYAQPMHQPQQSGNPMMHQRYGSMHNVVQPMQAQPMQSQPSGRHIARAPSQQYLPTGGPMGGGGARPMAGGNPMAGGAPGGAPGQSEEEACSLM